MTEIERCRRCGGLGRKENSLCSPCMNYYTRAQLYARRRKQGLCWTCGERPLPGRPRCFKCMRRATLSARKLVRKLKLEVMAHYGGALCSCCKEETLAFLTMDHVNGGGAQHRKADSSATRIYRWLKKHDYPEGFRVLCMNCNWGARGNDGVCPHKSL